MNNKTKTLIGAAAGLAMSAGVAFADNPSSHENNYTPTNNIDCMIAMSGWTNDVAYFTVESAKRCFDIAKDTSTTNMGSIWAQGFASDEDGNSLGAVICKKGLCEPF